MIATLFVIALAGLGLAYVAVPLRTRAAAEDDSADRLVDEIAGRKRSALMAILDIDDEREAGKLDDSNYAALRTQYEVEAVKAMRELDELGSTGPDDELEREIAKIRADLTCPKCGAARRPGEPCPGCSDT